MLPRIPQTLLGERQPDPDTTASGVPITFNAAIQKALRATIDSTTTGTKATFGKATMDPVEAVQIRQGLRSLGEPQVSMPEPEVATPFAAGWQPMKRAYGGRGIA